jgi:hypothetical protein
VDVDMSPPEISYEIGKTATGADTGQLRVVIKDPQSGVDHSKTVVDNLSKEVKPGVPVVNPVARSSAETFAKQVGLYDLIFPTFEPTQQANASGDFSIASLDGALPDAGFASLLTFNNLGLKAIVKMFGTNINNIAIPLSGNCASQPSFGVVSHAKLIGAFDYDRIGKNTRNVTLYFKLSFVTANSLGGESGDTVNGHSPSGTRWLKKITVNNRTDLVQKPRDRAKFEKQDNIDFSKDNLTDICYGTNNCFPISQLFNPVFPDKIGISDALLHLSINMNSLPNQEQDLVVRIPNRDNSAFDAITIHLTPSTLKGENWKSIECQ